METAQERAFGNPEIPLVAAVFLSEKAAGDAIADLNLGGFTASDIGVAVSPEDGVGRPSGKAAGEEPEKLQQEHSLFWKIRHANAHDIDRAGPGPGLTSKHDERAADAGLAYTVLDLPETLRARGIAEDTIHLLSREVGAEGILILVRALERHDKVESILVRNHGHLRTAMAVEKHPAQM
jgi:hypothetical protein